MQPVFWLILGKIIWIDVLLSGDNAVVIAMACRGLPENKRFWGMFLGAGAAIALRIALTAIAASVLSVPYLKLVGGLALIWIAVKLLSPSDDNSKDIKHSTSLLAAIGVIVVADATMSIDNIVAIAAVSQNDLLLLSLGLLISISLIVVGASVIMLILNEIPLLIWAGAALLGYIAGELIYADTAQFFPPNSQTMCAFVIASIVILFGLFRKANSSELFGDG